MLLNMAPKLPEIYSVLKCWTLMPLLGNGTDPMVLTLTPFLKVEGTARCCPYRSSGIPGCRLEGLRSCQTCRRDRTQDRQEAAFAGLHIGSKDIILYLSSGRHVFYSIKQLLTLCSSFFQILALISTNSQMAWLGLFVYNFPNHLMPWRGKRKKCYVSLGIRTHVFWQ